MTILAAAYRRVLLPAFESGWHRRGTFGHLRALEQSQWENGHAHEQRQLAALRQLLDHAATSCPYYRQVWGDLGLDPRKVESPADFAAWPVIDRDVIRANRMHMRSEREGLRLISKATGGSSGVPLQFDLDTTSHDRKVAAAHRGYAWAGAELGTKQFHLWGVPAGKRSHLKQWKDRLYHALYRRRLVNSFTLSDDRVPWYLNQLNAHRPDAIVAYTTPLYYFARVLAERGVVPWSPKTIVVGAEKLHDFQRELIEQVFQAPVFETYGSREFMLIGGECSVRQGLHLTMENLLVEILDDEGRPTPAGQEGNVVVTDLTNYGMPFIRYANGDRAIAGFGECPCGRGLPLLKQIIGRRLDILTTPDGRHISGPFFPHILKEYEAVRRFQVVQETPARMVLKVVVSDAWSVENERSLASDIESVTGPTVDVQIEKVDEIPLTATGKLRVVVNLCSSEGAVAPSPQEAASVARE